MRHSAAATAGLATSSAFAKNAPKSGVNETIRIGLIGCGERGSHLANYIKQLSEAELVAICDVNEPHLDRTYKLMDEKPKRYRPRLDRYYYNRTNSIRRLSFRFRQSISMRPSTAKRRRFSRSCWRSTGKNEPNRRDR